MRPGKVEIAGVSVPARTLYEYALAQLEDPFGGYRVKKHAALLKVVGFSHGTAPPEFEEALEDYMNKVMGRPWFVHMYQTLEEWREGKVRCAACDIWFPANMWEYHVQHHDDPEWTDPYGETYEDVFNRILSQASA